MLFIFEKSEKRTLTSCYFEYLKAITYSSYRTCLYLLNLRSSTLFRELVFPSFAWNDLYANFAGLLSSSPLLKYFKYWWILSQNYS